MKKFAVLWVCFVLVFNLYGQVKDTAYIHTFGGIQNDGCKQVQPTPDGGYIMIGTTSSYGPGNTNFYAIKTDSLCNFKWSKCYGGSLDQAGFSVIPTLDKGYAFVGFTNSFGAGGYDVYLVKADSMGNEQWQQTYGGSNWDFGYSIQQVSDTGYVICGLTYSYGSPNGSLYVVRTDKKGNALWTKTIGDSAYTVGNSLVVREDSLYIIAGATTAYGTGGDTNAILVQINDKGTVEWTKVYGYSTDVTFSSIHTTPDKAFVMYGRTDSIHGSTQKDSIQFECMYKTDTLGNLVFISGGLLPSPEYGYGADARQTADGSFLTLGSNASYGAGEQDFRAFHLSPGGWYDQGSTFGGPDEELAGSIAIGKNGDVIFAGSSNSPLFSCGLYDVFMIRLRLKNDSLPPSYDTLVTKYTDTTQFPASIQFIQQYNVGVNVFPDPVATTATILVQGSDMEKYTYNLFDVNGKCLFNGVRLTNVGHGQALAILQRGNLSTGEYVYEIISNGNMKVATGKLIIE